MHQEGRRQNGPFGLHQTFGNLSQQTVGFGLEMTGMGESEDLWFDQRKRIMRPNPFNLLSRSRVQTGRDDQNRPGILFLWFLGFFGPWGDFIGQPDRSARQSLSPQEFPGRANALQVLLRNRVDGKNPLFSLMNSGRKGFRALVDLSQGNMADGERSFHGKNPGHPGA